ncbi:hypothetical protein [Lacihabitans soyangensis]|uniref:Uncharacterized protein n=1 Tax=Lacihabitans soyangensis TaxID=869394 RepID=A0AAE3KU87_9BACT|nr:hypothetical protein [Lacihabitans soyangensis]MCP9762951.1 hypothetical protein [Lacihabitans soyangensis]
MKYKKMNLEPRIIIFLGGLIALIGTFITIYGTLQHNKASSEKSTKILEAANKSLNTSKESLEKAIESLDKLVKIQQDAKLINDNITGGKSYPQLEIDFNEKTKDCNYYLKIIGTTRLNNLKFSSLNISDVMEFYEKHPQVYGYNSHLGMAFEKDAKASMEREKKKAFSSSTKLRDGSFSNLNKEYVGKQIFDAFSYSNFLITGLLIEASNGKYYQIFNWGKYDLDSHKYPHFFIKLETILFDENGNILYEEKPKHDYFLSPKNKLQSIKELNFEKVKEYFEEKNKFTQ